VGFFDRIMTALFGPRCEHGCGMRVYRKQPDLDEHAERYCTTYGQEGAQWS
jgi:hypothetical protein